jgi:hypothetical protein
MRYAPLDLEPVPAQPADDAESARRVREVERSAPTVMDSRRQAALQARAREERSVEHRLLGTIPLFFCGFISTFFMFLSFLTSPLASDKVQGSVQALAEQVRQGISVRPPSLLPVPMVTRPAAHEHRR